MVALVYPGFTADEPTLAGRALVTAADAATQRSLLGFAFLPADDTAVMHLAGAETVTGQKTFNQPLRIATPEVIGGSLWLGVVENGVDKFGYRDFDNGDLYIAAKSPLSRALRIIPSDPVSGDVAFRSNGSAYAFRNSLGNYATVQASTLDNPAAALTLGNATFGVAVAGALTASIISVGNNELYHYGAGVLGLRTSGGGNATGLAYEWQAASLLTSYGDIKILNNAGKIGWTDTYLTRPSASNLALNGSLTLTTSASAGLVPLTLLGATGQSVNLITVGIVGNTSLFAVTPEGNLKITRDNPVVTLSGNGGGATSAGEIKFLGANSAWNFNRIRSYATAGGANGTGTLQIFATTSGTEALVGTFSGAGRLHLGSFTGTSAGELVSNYYSYAGVTYPIIAQNQGNSGTNGAGIKFQTTGTTGTILDGGSIDVRKTANTSTTSTADFVLSLANAAASASEVLRVTSAGSLRTIGNARIGYASAATVTVPTNGLNVAGGWRVQSNGQATAYDTTFDGNALTCNYSAFAITNNWANITINGQTGLVLSSNTTNTTIGGPLGIACTPSRGKLHVKQTASTLTDGITLEAQGGVDSFLSITNNTTRWIIDPSYITTGSYQPFEIRTAGVQRLSFETSGIATFKSVPTAPTWDSTTPFQIGGATAGNSSLKLFGPTADTNWAGGLDLVSANGTSVSASLRASSVGFFLAYGGTTRLTLGATTATFAGDITLADGQRVRSAAGSLRLGANAEMVLADTLKISGSFQAIEFGGTGAYCNFRSNVPIDFRTMAGASGTMGIIAGESTFNGTLSSPSAGNGTGERFGASSVTAQYSVAIGNHCSLSSSEAAVAVGHYAGGSYRSVSIGYYAAAGWQGVAIGGGSSTQSIFAAGGVAVGNSSYAHEGSIALGSNAVTTAANQFVVGNFATRWTMPATGQRNSEVGNGSGSWQTGYREEYNASGIRCGFYNATPIARQQISSGSGTLAADILAALNNLGLVQSL